MSSISNQAVPFFSKERLVATVKDRKIDLGVAALALCIGIICAVGYTMAGGHHDAVLTASAVFFVMSAGIAAEAYIRTPTPLKDRVQPFPTPNPLPEIINQEESLTESDVQEESAELPQQPLSEEPPELPLQPLSEEQPSASAEVPVTESALSPPNVDPAPSASSASSIPESTAQPLSSQLSDSDSETSDTLDDLERAEVSRLVQDSSSELNSPDIDEEDPELDSDVQKNSWCSTAINCSFASLALGLLGYWLHSTASYYSANFTSSGSSTKV